MNKPLIFLGGGGHCSAVADVARSAGFAIAGVLCNEEPGDASSLTRLGSDEWLDDPRARAHGFVVAVGQTRLSPLRARLFAALQQRGLDVVSVLAPSAQCSDGAIIGAGTAVMHRAVIGPHARIGQNCIINTGAIVEHDAQVGDHCHVSTGAILNGGVRIGAMSLIGSGAVVLQQVSIGESVLIGAGSVVLKDIREPGVYAGVPARRIQ